MKPKTTLITLVYIESDELILIGDEFPQPNLSLLDPAKLALVVPNREDIPISKLKFGSSESVDNELRCYPFFTLDQKGEKGEPVYEIVTDGSAGPVHLFVLWLLERVPGIISKISGWHPDYLITQDHSHLSVETIRKELTTMKRLCFTPEVRSQIESWFAFLEKAEKDFRPIGFTVRAFWDRVNGCPVYFNNDSPHVQDLQYWTKRISEISHYDPMKKKMFRLGQAYVITTSYYTHEVEFFDSSAQKIFSFFLEDNQRDWFFHVALFMYAYRITHKGNLLFGCANPELQRSSHPIWDHSPYPTKEFNTILDPYDHLCLVDSTNSKKTIRFWFTPGILMERKYTISVCPGSIEDRFRFVKLDATHSTSSSLFVRFYDSTPSVSTESLCVLLSKEKAKDYTYSVEGPCSVSWSLSTIYLMDKTGKTVIGWVPHNEIIEQFLINIGVPVVPFKVEFQSDGTKLVYHRLNGLRIKSLIESFDSENEWVLLKTKQIVKVSRDLFPPNSKPFKPKTQIEINRVRLVDQAFIESQITSNKPLNLKYTLEFVDDQTTKIVVYKRSQGFSVKEYITFYYFTNNKNDDKISVTNQAFFWEVIRPNFQRLLLPNQDPVIKSQSPLVIHFDSQDMTIHQYVDYLGRPNNLPMEYFIPSDSRLGGISPVTFKIRRAYPFTVQQVFIDHTHLARVGKGDKDPLGQYCTPGVIEEYRKLLGDEFVEPLPWLQKLEIHKGEKSENTLTLSNHRYVDISPGSIWYEKCQPFVKVGINELMIDCLPQNHTDFFLVTKGEHKAIIHLTTASEIAAARPQYTELYTLLKTINVLTIYIEDDKCTGFGTPNWLKLNFGTEGTLANSVCPIPVSHLKKRFPDAIFVETQQL